MRQRNLWWLFGVTWILTAALELGLVYLLAPSGGRDFWPLLMAPVYAGPLLAYLLCGAALVAIVVYSIAWAIGRYQHNQLSRRLATLVAGQYENAVVARQGQTARVLGMDVAGELETLRQQLIRTQGEIERYASAPVVIGGETKDEILTQERHRLARELHDSVSQQLFAAMMMLSALKSVVEQPAADGPTATAETAPPDLAATVRQQIGTIESVINEAQAEMRALLLHLRPTTLEGKSLAAGIIALLQELQTKIAIAITWDLDDVTLAPAVEDNLFRIVQELLSNTLRHAKAAHLEVYLKQLATHVVLRVVDDGVGFDPATENTTGSYGLSNIQERAAAVGGTAKVISFPHQGTSVEVRVPIAKDKAND